MLHKSGNFMAALFGVRLLGFMYLFLGLMGFLPFPDLNPMHSEGVGAHYLLNLIAVNTVNNSIHLVLGVTALLSVRNPGFVRVWGLAAGSALIGLFIAGIAQAFFNGFPGDQVFLGLIPLNSPGHMLHLVTGCAALSIGLSLNPRGGRGKNEGESTVG